MSAWRPTGMMRRLTLALVVATGLLVALPGTAMACSCATDDAAAIVRDAPVVVEGAVVATSGLGHGEVTHTMRVDRVLKGGPVPGWVEVTSARSGSACGIEGDLSARQVFALDRSGTAYSSSLCSQPGLGEGLTVAELRGRLRGRDVGLDPQPPTPASRPLSSRVPGGEPVLWGGAAVLLLAGAGVAWVVRRRRAS